MSERTAPDGGSLKPRTTPCAGSRASNRKSGLAEEAWSNLPVLERAKVIAVWREIELAGLTVPEVWRTYKELVGVVKPQPLGKAIEALIESKTVGQQAGAVSEEPPGDAQPVRSRAGRALDRSDPDRRHRGMVDGACDHARLSPHLDQPAVDPVQLRQAPGMDRSESLRPSRARRDRTETAADPDRGPGEDMRDCDPRRVPRRPGLARAGAVLRPATRRSRETPTGRTSTSRKGS